MVPTKFIEMMAVVWTQWWLWIFWFLVLICCLHNANLGFSSGMIWMSPRVFCLCDDWLGAECGMCAQRLTRHPSNPNNTFGRWLYTTDAHPLSFSYDPHKSKKMKTCCDVTSKIGFWRICCDKSLIKVVYFSVANVRWSTGKDAHTLIAVSWPWCEKILTQKLLPNIIMVSAMPN